MTLLKNADREWCVAAGDPAITQELHSTVQQMVITELPNTKRTSRMYFALAAPRTATVGK